MFCVVLVWMGNIWEEFERVRECEYTGSCSSGRCRIVNGESSIVEWWQLRGRLEVSRPSTLTKRRRKGKGS